MATTVPCRIGQIPAAASIGKQKRIRRSPPLPFPHLPPRLRSRLRRNTARQPAAGSTGQAEAPAKPTRRIPQLRYVPHHMPGSFWLLRPPLQNSLALPGRACSSAPESPPNATVCPSLKRKNLNPANDLQINCLWGSAALAADPDSIERQGIRPWMNKRNPLKRSRTKRRSRTRSPMSPGPKWQIIAAWFFLILMVLSTILYYYWIAYRY